MSAFGTTAAACCALRLGVATLLIVALMPFASAQTQPAQPPQEEAKVKAAFLLRFVQYVEWPQDALPQATTPIVIGVIAADAIAAELSQMTAGRTGQGRPVTVRAVNTSADFAAVHVLFIGRGDAKIAQHAGAVRARPVLVVTEAPDALEHGSMINFVIADRRVRFEIALDPAEKAGLSVSSRLLAVAMRVHKGELATGTPVAVSEHYLRNVARRGRL